MRKTFFFAFLFSLIGIANFAACRTSGSGDDSTNSHSDDTTTVDDTTSDDSVDDDIDDDSVLDDTASDDDTILDDDSGFTFPSNIVLYGIVSSIVGGGPHQAALDIAAVQQYSSDYNGLISLWPNCQLNDIWGSSPKDLYAIGIESIEGLYDYTYSRFIAHLNVNHWNVTLDPGQYWTLESICGTSVNDIYMVGNINGSPYVIYHFDGLNWNIEKTGSQWSSLNSIWVSPSGLVVAIGLMQADIKENGIWRETYNVRGVTVWGSPDDIVFAAGANEVYRYENSEWFKMNTPELTDVNLTKIAGISPTDIYGLGWLSNENYSKGLLHFDGTSWSKITIPTGEADSTIAPGGLWVAAHDSVFVSLISTWAPKGQVLYYDGINWHIISQDIGANALWGFVNP